MSSYGHNARYEKTKGMLVEGGQRMIAIRFDNLTFRKIADEAHDNQRSFAEQVRFYVGLGMDKEKKS